MRSKFWSSATRSTKAAVFTLLAFTLLTALATISSLRSLSYDSMWVSHSHEVIEQLQKLQTTLTDAETGQRGFLLTGDEAYLTPYMRTQERFEKTLDETAELTKDNPRQNAEIRKLKQYADAKFEELAETIALRRDVGFDAALAVVRDDRGAELMTAFRASISEIIAEQRRLLAIRAGDRQRTETVGVLVAVLAALLTLGAFLAAGFLVNRLFDEVALARDHAEAATKSRGEFLANMSHEIRTPMTAILGFSDILRDRTSDPDDLTTIQTIRDNGRFLLRILNDILDLSKIDAGMLEMRSEMTEIEPLFEDVKSLLSVLAADKTVDFELVFVGPVPRMIRTDAGRLRQILINLVGNALKFTDEGLVRVEVSYESDEGSLVMKIRDTGSGIAPASLSQMFAAFRQEDESNTRRKGGTGLGLTISRRLADALGGSLTVESQLGVGTTFTVKIPCGDLTEVDLINATLGVKRTTEDATVGADSLNCRVLVVDDRREIRFLLRRIIENAGGRVVEAENGREGLELLRIDEGLEATIDVCVMDMQMPVMDGYEATRRLRRNAIMTPVIALTADAMSEDRDECMNAGCSDYMTKPIDAAALRGKISTWCGRSHTPAVSKTMSGGHEV